MNFRRGLFRVWIVLSAAWIIAGVALSYQAIANPQLPDEVYIMKDANSGFFKLDNPFDQFDSNFAAGHSARIEFPNNVSLFPAKDVPEAIVRAQAATFFQRYSQPREGALSAARVATSARALPLIFGPPLALLALAAVVGWVVAGFRKASA